MYRTAKRAYDIMLAGVGLLVMAPFLAIIAILIKMGDGGPVFYRQVRVGLQGKLFRIWKFRTMVPDSDRQGLAITAEGDPRITRLGKWLREKKIDEFPQLWNVIRGEMSLVGPRPEVPRYVAIYNQRQREVLELRPGITDLATLEFRKEEELLGHASDVEKFYVEYCLPRKIELNLLYARRANLWEDTKVILRTLVANSNRTNGR